MKKLISTILCLTIAASSVLAASAAQTSDEQSNLNREDFLHPFRIVGSDTIPDNTVRMYCFGPVLGSNSSMGLEFASNATGQSSEVCCDLAPNTSKDIWLPESSGYEVSTFLQTGTGTSYGSYTQSPLTFNNTGGKYNRVRLKPGSFSSYFDEKGTVTYPLLNNVPYTFDFRNNHNDGYYSMCAFVSGGAMTVATPTAVPGDTGFVEIYCSTQIGVGTYFTTKLCYRGDRTSSSAGCSGERLAGLTIGDPTKDNSVSLADAILIQKYSVKMTSFDDISLYAGDIDQDGEVNFKDSLLLQKYVLGL